MSRSGGHGIGSQLLALAVFVLVLWAQFPDAYAGVTDDGLHLVIAKAIARGEGLHFIHQPGAPPAAFFPPLFAAAAGAIGAIFPDFPANLLLVQIVNAAALAGAAWFAVGLARSLRLSCAVAYAAVAFGFLNVAVISTTVRSFPEPLSLLWWFGALATVRWVENDRRWAIAAGGIAAAAVLTTYAGWAVLAGVIGGLLMRGHRVPAGFAIGTAAAVAGPWLLWSFKMGSAPMATASVTLGLSSVAASWTDAARLIHPAGGGVLAAVAVMLVAVVGSIGMWRAWPDAPEWIITIVAHVACLFALPGTERSVWVLMPSAILLAVVGGRWIWSAAPRARRPFAALSALMIVAVLVFNGVAMLDRRFISAPTEAEQETARLFIAGMITETPATAVVATDADALLHLYTERLSTPLLPIGTTAEDGEGTYCAMGAAYVAPSGLRPDEGGWTPPPSADRVFVITDGPALYRLACE